MPFYHFSQNNSGGHFKGLYKNIIIEAKTADEANKIACDVFEVYFDGVYNGSDCDCCGDRWYPAMEPGDDAPMIYGMPAEQYETVIDWGVSDVIRYADGHELVILREKYETVEV